MLRWALLPVVLAADLKEMLSQGDTLRKVGALEEARTVYTAAAESFPSRSEPFFLLGMTTRAQGNDKAAMAHYKVALQVDPLMAEAHSDVIGFRTHAIQCNPLSSHKIARLLAMRHIPLSFEVVSSSRGRGHPPWLERVHPLPSPISLLALLATGISCH